MGHQAINQSFLFLSLWYLPAMFMFRMIDYFEEETNEIHDANINRHIKALAEKLISLQRMIDMK